MTYLYLDDIRSPNDNLDYHWVIVRTYEEAVQWCEYNGCPNVLALDHDLGMAIQDNKLVCVDFEAKSGFDFVKWLIKKDLDSDQTFIPKDFSFSIHSSNPDGSEKMKLALENHLDKVSKKKG